MSTLDLHVSTQQSGEWAADPGPLKQKSIRCLTAAELMAAHKRAMRRRATELERHLPKCSRAIAKAWEEV